jgi:hypothetical protein
MACPGSIREEAGKEDPTSIFAAEGTVAHQVLEACLKSGANAVGFLGQTRSADGFTFVVDQEMVDGVQMMVDYVRKVMLDAPGRVELAVERRDGLDKLNLPEPVFGTTDVRLWGADSKHLHIIDFKYGKGVVVEVEDNEQLLIYALAQVLAIGVKPALIRLHVVQPRAHHADGPIRTAEVTFEELVAFKQRVKDAVVAVQDPNAPLNPGDHCRFCPASPTCPAQHALAVEIARTEFDAPLPEPADLDQERLLFALQHMDTVRAWFNRVEEHAMDRIRAGADFPGFKLVRGRSNRKWKDEAAAEKALAKAGLKKKERMTSEVLSPSQAEKALKKIGKELPADLWEKPEGKLTLVPEADPRPPVTALSSAQDDFAALPPAA